MVSILVPVYCAEPYIERCARSLFEQTYSDLEYVFVNDCTPDQSVEVLKEVVNDYPNRISSVKVVNHEKNRGLAAARNTAYEAAAGDFVTIVDSDDWLELDAVELLVKIQLETNADIVSGAGIAHCEDGDSVMPSEYCNTKDEMVCHMMGVSGQQYVWGRLIRRKLFEDHSIRWMDGYDCAEDRFIMTKLSYYAKSYGNVDYPIYHYERRNMSSMMSLMNSNVMWWLKMGCQEVSNYVTLMSFFEDKEVLFFNRCKECTDSIVEYHLIPSMEGAIKQASLKDCVAIFGLIDDYPLVHSNLNWPQEVSNRRNYYFLKSLWTWRWFRRKVKSFVSKKLK